MENTIYFKDTQRILKVAAVKAIMNKNIPGYGKIADCKLASDTVDKADKTSIFIKFENDKKLYPANIKIRYIGRKNYSISDYELLNNTFIIYYEKPFSNEYITALNNSINPSSMLVNEPVYILRSSQIIEEIYKNSLNTKFYEINGKDGFWVLRNGWVNQTAEKCEIL
ncbi:MAG: hypothetical protein [Wendovervirus sonii]|uniref:Uncharacterized protein n=1 Tax=phage Lak_Megaphage_Sonny TaxID=3109229 RepID=A0ABZ0Z2W6_9CAUD|nr:MAG: hypothetical protein [phage Lak_Megaphage_Sonny]